MWKPISTTWLKLRIQCGALKDNIFWISILHNNFPILGTLLLQNFVTLRQSQSSDFQWLLLESTMYESEKLMGRIGDPDWHFEYNLHLFRRKCFLIANRLWTLKYVVFKCCALYILLHQTKANYFFYNFCLAQSCKKQRLQNIAQLLKYSAILPV